MRMHICTVPVKLAMSVAICMYLPPCFSQHENKKWTAPANEKYHWSSQLCCKLKYIYIYMCVCVGLCNDVASF